MHRTLTRSHNVAHEKMMTRRRHGYVTSACSVRHQDPSESFSDGSFVVVGGGSHSNWAFTYCERADTVRSDDAVAGQLTVSRTGWGSSLG